MSDNLRYLYKSKDRHVVKDLNTGKVREVVYDQKYKEAVKRGDFMQPVGKDKAEWLDRHPENKINSKGEIYNVEQKQEEKLSEEKYQSELTNEQFNQRRKNYDKKYY